MDIIIIVINIAIIISAIIIIIPILVVIEHLAPFLTNRSHFTLSFFAAVI